MSTSEIAALISLIEDPDERIFHQVRSEIVARGSEIVPQLEKYWEHNHFGVLFQERIESLIQSIHFNGIADSLSDWSCSEDADLLEGALLINRYQYPSYDEDEIRRTLSTLRQDIWLELNDNLTAIEQVNVINHILYNVYGFSGNKANYSAPQNNFLSDVLSLKKGNPLTMAVVYQVLANRLEIPIYGVNLPNHFLLAYLDENNMGMSPETCPNDGILFYINPFSGGTIIHKSEIDAFLMHLELPQAMTYYQPCSSTTIVKRMINNLIYAYGKQGKSDKVDDLKKLVERISE
jgi:regulator of sirC expression with transglutaminase-like and TPR domain